MPTVIGQDVSASKTVTHKKCGAVIQYVDKDVRVLWSGKDYAGGPDGAKGFDCPQCGEHVILERW